MRCPYCSATIADGSKFCPACGKKLAPPAAPADAAAFAPPGAAPVPPAAPLPTSASAHPGSAPAAPSFFDAPPQPAAQPPVPSRPRKKRGLLAAIGVAAFLVIGVIAIAALVRFRAGSMGAGASSGSGASGNGIDAAQPYSDNLSSKRYKLNEPQTDLDPTHDFTFDIKGTPQLPKGTGGAYAAARVYADGSLTTEVPAYITLSGSQLTVSPANLDAQDSTRATVGATDDIFHAKDKKDYNFGRWYGYGGYYLVRYLGDDGRMLKKPEVTYFTVKDDVNDGQDDIARPQNQQFSVSSTGGLRVSWDAVKGASGYRVYLIAVDRTGDSQAKRYIARLLAKTKKTSIDTTDFDPAYQTEKRMAENADANEHREVNQQNNAFRQLVIGDTEEVVVANRIEAKQYGAQGLEVSDYVPNASKVKATMVCVVAEGDFEGQQSAFQFESINDLLGKMPLEVSVQPILLKSQGEQPTGGDKIDVLTRSLTSFVNMADGTCVKVQRTLDPSNARENSYSVTSGPDMDHLTTKNVKGWDVPWKLAGGSLTGEIFFDQPSWPGGLDEISQGVQQASAKIQQGALGGGLASAAEFNQGVDWDKVQESQKPVSKSADVPYRVNGSSDYVKFVASNLLAGNTYLDVTKYATAPGAPDIRDVVEEAMWQNPLILAQNQPAIRQTEQDGRVLVSIADSGFGATSATREQRLEQRKKAYAEVKKIVAGAIKGGMTDTQKVQALNDAICQRLTYNYDYLNATQFKDRDVKNRDDAKVGETDPFSLNVLLTGNKAICQGYSALFKACADEAGLEAVSVAGTVPKQAGMINNGHAWNLVKVDGAWKVVDTTWNDTDSAKGNRYTLLDINDPLLKGRAYNDRWILDTVITDYVDTNLLS